MIVLRYVDGCQGDFRCPECGCELEWDEDRLYSHVFEDVACPVCDHEFQVRQQIVTSYNVRG